MTSSSANMEQFLQIRRTVASAMDRLDRFDHAFRKRLVQELSVGLYQGGVRFPR
jgi:hypothetical protein